MSSLLSVESLSCERGYRQLFTDLSFEVSAGDAVRIAGPNGAGKSTLLKVLCGLSSDYSGDVLWCGETLRRCKDTYYNNLCFLGHAKAVKASLTVAENLEWFRSLYPCSDDDIASVLKRLGIAAYIDTLCSQLSAGQQQRVALARLLMSQARLWILDEPFTAIDKTGVAVFESMISEFVDGGGALIITTHHELHLSVPIRTVELGA